MWITLTIEKDELSYNICTVLLVNLFLWRINTIFGIVFSIVSKYFIVMNEIVVNLWMNVFIYEWKYKFMNESVIKFWLLQVEGI